MAGRFGADDKSPPVSSSFSTSAATFVPGQKLSAGASAFVPSTRAEPFVPAQTVWAPSAAEFVPGQSWSTGQDHSMSWQHNYQGGFGSASSSMYGGAAYNPYTLGSGVQCMVNLDGYSTDSSSSPSPRERSSNDKATTPAVPAKAEENGLNVEPVQVEKGSTEAPVPSIAQEKPSEAQEKPAEAQEKRNSEEKVEERSANEVQPVIDTEAPASLQVLSSPAKSNDSPLLGPAGSDEGRSATTSDNEAEDLSMRLPPAAQHDDCPIVEAAVVDERSERTLKQWLVRFATDRDTELFLLQWDKWISTGVGEPRDEITAWLLRHGLEDCRAASQVCSAFDLLLREAELLATAVKSALSEYSEDDLADLELDNPKVHEFVTSLQDVLSNLPETCTPKVRPKVQRKCSDESAATNGGVANDVSYSPEVLMQIRRELFKTSEIDNYSGPRWGIESATKSCGPMPSWQQNRLARNSRTSDADVEPASREWRDAQKKNADSRAKGRDGKNSGKTGRQKEAIQVSETSWVAQSRRWKVEAEKDQDIEDAVVDEQFLREMRLTLNKLTIEKFEHLSDRLIQLISESTRPNRGIPVLMQLVFEKATTQHHFIDMYVNLCVKLHKWLTAHNDIVRTESQTNLKRILLNQCQNSFELYLEPPDTLDGLIGDSLFEAQVKYKTKMLGNIKLVGQLIRHGMLSPKIALSVATELIQDDPMVRDERLETLAVFLETIGPALDDPNWTHSAQFDAIFTEVQRLCNDKALKSRIRFLLRDVLDLRQGKWQTSKSRSFDEAAPTTIAQVHEKAKLDNASGKGGGASSNSPQKGKRKSDISTNNAPIGSPKSKPASSPKSRPSENPKTNEKRAESPKYKPLQLLRRSSASNSSAVEPSSGSQAVPRNAESTEKLLGSPTGKPKDDLLAGLQKAVAGAAEKATKSKEEILALFHKEITQIIRQVTNSHDLKESVQRLRQCPLPTECVQEEVVDLIARMIDEPKQRRQHLFPLLTALFDAGVFSPPGVLGIALASFIEDAFQDPGSVDPPDLVDIILRELLPTLGVSFASLKIAPCIAELFAEIDDG